MLDYLIPIACLVPLGIYFYIQYRIETGQKKEFVKVGNNLEDSG